MVCLFKLGLHSLIHPFVLFYISFTAFLLYLPLSSLASLFPVNLAGVEQHQWTGLDIPGTWSQVMGINHKRFEVHEVGSSIYWRKARWKKNSLSFSSGFMPRHFTSQFVQHQTLARHSCALWLLLSILICVNINAALKPTSSFVAKRWNEAIHQEYREPFSSLIRLAYPFYTYPSS